MWLLLQPRGHLGGYFLYAALAGGAIGLVLGSVTSDRLAIQYPAFIGWTSAKGQPLFPMLFITIACGACSGFHSLIASGTTSKQLKVETDAKADRLRGDAAGGDGGHHLALLRDDAGQRLARC